MGRTLLFILLLASAPVGAKVLISETVGVVAGRVYTSREVVLSVLMDRLIDAQAGQSPLPFKRGSSPDARAVGHVLLEAAVAREAEGLGLVPEEGEAEAWATRTRGWLAGSADGRAYGFTEAEVRRVALEKSRSRGFIRMKSESLRGLVTDAEAETYFEQNRVKFGQLPFSAFRENIVSYLSQQRMEERLRSWFEILRRKYRVRELHGAARNDR